MSSTALNRDLESFVGQEFDLTAVGTNVLQGSQSDASNICFALDGHTYMAEEDPQDGYRSSLGTVRTIPFVLPNTFPACRVKCEWPSVDDDWNEDTNRILFRSVATNKIILEIGTDHADDYYPSFVASFQPQNMDINAGVPPELAPVALYRPDGWGTW